MNKCANSKKISFIEAIYKHQEYLQKRHLLSDFDGLNQIIGGGFESSLFYLLYGSSRIINSILLSMAIVAQLPTTGGGLDSAVIFIDNDNIFNPYSLIRLALSVNLNPNEVLAQISVARAFIWNHLGEIVDNLEALVEEQKARIVLISGLTTLFEGEFEQKKHQMLLKIANKLRTLASDYDLIVMASTRLAQGSTHKPAGGKIMSHAPHVLIRAIQQGERITFDLMKHPSYPEMQRVQWLSRPKKAPHTMALDQFLKKSVEQ
jgi:DNA repair protein RadA